MTITVNGQPTEVSDDTRLTLLEFLESRGLKADRVAVERNGEIIARTEWNETRLTPGDRLEVVHFVGGGSR